MENPFHLGFEPAILEPIFGFQTIFKHLKSKNPTPSKYPFVLVSLKPPLVVYAKPPYIFVISKGVG